MTPETGSPSTPSDTSANHSASGEFGGPDPLARLRERVEKAAHEIERLRQENARLAERVAELAQEDIMPADQHPAAVTIGENPEELKQKIQGFIDALDRVLAERSTRPADLLHEIEGAEAPDTDTHD